MKQITATCAFCGHKCLRDIFDSIFPEDDTPVENISVGMGDIRFSLLCSNPQCHKYTITCVDPADRDRLQMKYKLEKPSKK